MSSLTNRLGLIDPSQFDMMSIGDIQLSQNYQQIDTKIGITPCTSATRPAAPTTGQMIYETDTTKYYIWDGTTWQRSGEQGVGTFIGSTVSSGQQNFVGVETAMNNMALTFNAIAGVRYGIIAHVNLSQGAADRPIVNFRVANGSTVTTAGTLLWTQSFPFEIGGICQMLVVGYNAPATTQVTIGMFAYNFGGGGLASNGVVGGQALTSAMAIQAFR